jgi:multidrug efflux pump subunit AcrA (membrane-fusion protein)
VVDDKGAPRLRQVRIGTVSDETSVEVLAGLKAGERVAIEPVKAGMATGAAA